MELGIFLGFGIWIFSGLAPLSSQRTGIGDITFVKLDVFFRQIGSINERVGGAEVEVDVEIELSRSHCGTEGLEGGGCWLAL